MMTVNEVSKLSGVSIRTLQYYDTIGLLKATEHTEAGYRLYDDAALERLQQILLFRELEFPLKDIRRILSAPDFDREKALTQQIDLLTMKKEHLENLLEFAREIKKKGVRNMDFQAFDKKTMEEYAKRAKEQWGRTEEFRESEAKRAGRSASEEAAVAAKFMELFAEFGQMKETDPEGETAQLQVKKLQDYISEHYYNCSKQVLGSLGQMYAAGGGFTANIDAAGGAGTAEFAARAIEVYCAE